MPRFGFAVLLCVALALNGGATPGLVGAAWGYVFLRAVHSLIHVTYNRLFVRPLDDLSGVDEEMYARNPPAFATLMGCDDTFGKSSYTGHDGPRFAYAARHLQRT